MIISDKNIVTSDNDSTPNEKLMEIIRKKGKRDTANFKKAFGKYPDLPSKEELRKISWR